MSNLIFKNYEAFYTMVASTFVMTNSRSEAFDSDCDKIIDLIGKSYKLSDEVILSCKNAIRDLLSPIGLVSDKNAIYSARTSQSSCSDDEILFDIKCDVLSDFDKFADSRLPGMNGEWFNYSHYLTYNAYVRFEEIKRASIGGQIIPNRQVAILQILGLGCEKDLQEGINRLIRCTAWGDIPSAKLLAYALELNGNTQKANDVWQTTELLDKYLYGGYTVVPQTEKQKYSETARTYYVYISTILQDVILANKRENIDFSFIEALLSEDLDYYKRMYYIHNYDRKEWTEVTNSAEKPSKKIGFR
ncbi:MAG: hypothetical protein IJW13_06685 [Clostridia bacterium]|nr:hypothetical protein [Clostridia bacterium]